MWRDTDTLRPPAHLVLLSLLCTAMVAEAQVMFQDKGDYCQLENFNVTCGEDEIIVLISALYGRMRPGRCITRSYGNLGCSANVLQFMDTKCSGKRHCMIQIPDPMLHRTQPCPKDFTAYLEVEYQCIKVVHRKTASCPGEAPERHLEAGEGYLSGPVLKTQDAMNALTNPCPWIITAHPGQQINISIVNFNSTQKAPYNSYGYLGSGRGPCVDVAKVTDGGAQDAIQLCRHQKREVTAYVSRSHDITLHLPTTPADHGGGIFLLKFKAIGCPDVTSQAGMWVKRSGDTAMVRCNLTEETWYLSCEDNEWKGRVGNCSQAAKKWNVDERPVSDEPVPYGILITVAIGAALGIFLGGILLAIVLLIRKYRLPMAREQEESDYHTRETLARKSYDLDKGYAPVLDDRGHFPVCAERFPLPVSIPECPDTTQVPMDITQGTLPRETIRIETPMFCAHPECHVYESTRLGLSNNKRTS